MVTVGVANGQIAYVSSSLTKTTGSPAQRRSAPLEGWLKAAANVGRAVPRGQVGDIVTSVASAASPSLDVPGFAQQQQARLRALAHGRRLGPPGHRGQRRRRHRRLALAYTAAWSTPSPATILHRHNQVDNAGQLAPFNGSTPRQGCGPLHQFTLADNATKQIVAVSVGLPLDDQVVKLFDPAGNLLVSGDLGTNPEAATYQSNSIPAGTYAVQVCPYDAPTVPANVGPLLGHRGLHQPRAPRRATWD